MSDILYVRNRRPNAVLVRVDGIKYTVERRGSREDSAALPGAWRNDPGVSAFLHQGILEEISKDAFMALGSRPEDTIVEDRQGRTRKVPGPTDLPLVERAANEVNVPINPDDHRQPTVITDETLRKTAKLRSPNPEFAGEIPSTADDLAAIEEARRAAEASPGQVDFEEDETAQLRKQVQELTGLVHQLLSQGETAAQQAEEAQAPKAKRGRPKGSTKKATATKKAAVKKELNPMSPEGKEPMTSRDFME